MDIHLYLMCYRTEALVASQLKAEEFGAYMAVGTQKKTFGNVVFFEIDPTFRSKELHLDQVEAKCKAHPDGTPRRSKYMSLYRVMERVPLSAYGKLHLTTRDGRVLSLNGRDFDEENSSEGPFMYAELCPLTSRVVSHLGPKAFAQRITDPKTTVCVPRIFFAETQVELDDGGHLASYLPYANPSHIEDCIREVEERPNKLGKTVDRNPPLAAFYRTIATGFYLGDSTGIKFYAYPDVATLDAEHHTWWRSASMG
ncbi:hypothetical protein [Bythopirellula goksoeyrii]|uniref:Uncharacterized protein n=1 Tax=Bythopirellula goksoeyrii TaxID=1400387 RepID=A0A5B9Q418_9BACT|nr:hypothetical protein [Bythopirellula goksoeyrii]QEG33778.1 hypothetical protein Pr1d_10480 [Bythopirellula goksoeyrii]